jgi:hypothetical protein
MKEITKNTEESQNILTLIRHVREKYEELKLYRPNTTDLRVLQEREKMDHIYTLLAALEPRYEPIRAQILLLKFGKRYYGELQRGSQLETEAESCCLLSSTPCRKG